MSGQSIIWSNTITNNATPFAWTSGTGTTSTPFIVNPSKCDLCGAQTTNPYVLSVTYAYNNISTAPAIWAGNTTLVKTLCQDCYTILKLTFEVGTGSPPAAPAALMAYAFLTRMGTEFIEMLNRQGGAGGAAVAASLQAVLPLILKNMGITIPPTAQPPAPPTPPSVPPNMGVCEACRMVAPVARAKYFGHVPQWDLCQVCSPRPYMDIQRDCPKCEACGKAGHHALTGCPP